MKRHTHGLRLILPFLCVGGKEGAEREHAATAVFGVRPNEVSVEKHSHILRTSSAYTAGGAGAYIGAYAGAVTSANVGELRASSVQTKSGCSRIQFWYRVEAGSRASDKALGIFERSLSSSDLSHSRWRELGRTSTESEPPKIYLHSE